MYLGNYEEMGQLLYYCLTLTLTITFLLGASFAGLLDVDTL